MTIESLDLSSDAEPESANLKLGFWKRQFQLESTDSQHAFDWTYGVGVPLLCVIADPIVFRGGGILAAYRPFAYLLSSVSIMAMIAWLLWGKKKLAWLAAPVGGLFVAGSIVSFIVGLILLPFSLLGLFFIIGFLGFTPLFSGLVYLRNGIRALHASGTVLDQRVVWQSAVLAGLLALIVPYVVNAHISRIVREIATADVNTIRLESAKLRYIKPLADLTPVRDRYYESSEEERNTPRMKELARVYEDITEENLELHNIFDD